MKYKSHCPNCGRLVYRGTFDLPTRFTALFCNVDCHLYFIERNKQIMSFLDKLKNVTPFIQVAVQNLPLPEEAIEKVTQINSLLQYALPIAKVVASTTATQYDDKAVSMLTQLGLAVGDILSHTAGTKQYVDGNKQLLTKELLRDDLVKRVEAGEQIPFGQNKVLTTKEQVLAIPNSTLDAIVTSANAINKGQV